jgi:hypothetical protein
MGTMRWQKDVRLLVQKMNKTGQFRFQNSWARFNVLFSWAATVDIKISLCKPEIKIKNFLKAVPPGN